MTPNPHSHHPGGCLCLGVRGWGGGVQPLPMTLLHPKGKLELLLLSKETSFHPSLQLAPPSGAGSASPSILGGGMKDTWSDRRALS